jgi:hypothetical protein
MGELEGGMIGMAAGNQVELEGSLRSVWADVLGVDEAGFSNDSSFLTVSGDSLAALHGSSKLRRLGLEFSASQIMPLGTNEAIAAAVSGSASPPVSKSPSELMAADEFSLSPVQQLQLQANPGGGNAFHHQALLLQVRRDITDDELRGAMSMLVEVHPMLRIRFRRLVEGEEEGHQQFMLDDFDIAFTLRVHAFTENVAERSVYIRHTQDELDAFKGPVFGADLFRAPGDSVTNNILSLTAHQLIIDLYSWRIITQDLEDWLGHGKRPSPEVTPFPVWLDALNTHARSIDNPPSLLPSPIPADAAAAAKFWSIENTTKSFQDAREYSFVLDAAVSANLLGWREETGVDTLDVLLGALLFSFSAVFGEDHVPAVFNGDHGREQFSVDMDISQTVGCFGTFTPITIEPRCPSISDAIHQVRKARKSAPNNGLSYFAARFLHPSHRKAFHHRHFPIEILFNYWGLWKSPARPANLLEPCQEQPCIPGSGPDRPRSPGAEMSRFCLIDVQVLSEEGGLKFKFVYNRKMRRQQCLFKWFGQVKSTCVSMANQVSPQPGRPLALTQPGPVKPAATPFIESVRLGLKGSRLDLTDNNLEDAYACPSVQQGMLVSMLNQRASIYDAHLLFRFNAAPSERVVSPTKLEKAWHKVIRKNTMLRTVFVESTGDKISSPFCMGVLRNANTSDVVRYKTCADEDDVLFDYDIETKKPSKCPLSALPLACLTIYQVSSSPRSLYCYLRESHLMMDAISSMCIITELLEGYTDKLDEEVIPYAEYVKYIERQSRNPSMDRFWGRYLKGLVPCWFPALTTLKERKAASATKTTELIPLCGTPSIQAFCRKYRLTVSNIAYAAWTLVLSRYTNQKEVCFGYPVSGRALPVRNIEKIIGPR